MSVAQKDLTQISDEEIFEAAAQRLCAQYLKDHETEFQFGSFRFIFHDGRFQSIEDWPRNRRYVV